MDGLVSVRLQFSFYIIAEGYKIDIEEGYPGGGGGVKGDLEGGFCFFDGQPAVGEAGKFSSETMGDGGGFAEFDGIT